MKFVERIKGKVSETKTKVAVARDRKQVREMISRLSSLPLCNEDDAYFIVESEVTEYFGRHDCFALDLDANPTEEEKEAEFENLKILRGQMQVFLEFLFDPSLQYSPSILKGSINARFHLKVLQYLDETQMPIDEAMYVSIIESMIAEGSGADMQECFTDNRVSDTKIDLFTWFQEYRDNFFPKNSFMKAGRTAQEKLDRYIELDKISAPFKELDEDGQRSNAGLGNLPVSVALQADTIGGGRTIKYLPMLEKEPVEM